MKTRQVELGIHAVLIIGFWLLINLPYFELTIGVFSTGDYSFVWPSFFGTIINAVIFYGNSFLLIPRFLRLRQTMTYISLLTLGFILCSALEVGIDYYLAKAMNLNVDKMGGLAEIILLVVLVNLLTLLASFAYRFSIDWFAHERLKHQLVEEKLMTELAFLKAQVNPHFLFNTLNNLFSMAIENQDQATAEGIQRLAGLMRYMLNDSNSERIALSKELEYIQHFIALQGLRWTQQKGPQIVLELEGEVENVQIAPMLLIPFVENAFKHGISMSTPRPISIQIWVSPSKLRLRVHNYINLFKKTDAEQISGHGLVNVKKRLDLLYPQRHQLEVKSFDDQFEVDLTLTL